MELQEEFPWSSVFERPKTLLDGWARIRDPKAMFEAVIEQQLTGKRHPP